jgi:hypothetical protein
MSRTRKKRGGSAPAPLEKKLSTTKRAEIESLETEKELKEQNEKQIKGDVFKKILKKMPFPTNYFVNPLAAMAVKGITNYKLFRRIMNSYVLKKHKYKKQYEVILSDPASKKEFEYACRLIKRYYDPNIGKQFEILRTSKEIHRSCAEYRVLDKQYKLSHSAKETNQYNNDTDILEIFGIFNKENTKSDSDEKENILPKNKFELLYFELKKKYDSPNSSPPMSTNPVNMNPIGAANPMNPIGMLNPIGMATSIQGGGIMNMAKSLGQPLEQMKDIASAVQGNKNNTNSVKNLKKAQEDYNHSKIENLFVLNKKNCSYIIPAIMIDIVKGSEYIYDNKDSKSEDEDNIENIKYIGIDLDCDTAYTLKDVLILTGLSKPVETATGIGDVDVAIDKMVTDSKKIMGGYSKRLVPKKRRLTRRRVKVTK